MYTWDIFHAKDIKNHFTTLHVECLAYYTELE